MSVDPREIEMDAWTIRQRIRQGWADWAYRLTVLLVRKCRDRGLPGWWKAVTGR